jgi:hypothetical protein
MTDEQRIIDILCREKAHYDNCPWKSLQIDGTRFDNACDGCEADDKEKMKECWKLFYKNEVRIEREGNY